MRAYKQQITNSNIYNNSLKQRGRLDFWIDNSIFSKWTYSGKQTQGGKVIYSDVVIEMILVLSYVYSLPLRQTEGFVNSLLALNGRALSVPDYATVCRRRKTLDVRKKLKKWNRKESIVFSIDGSGLKCCGEKEWMQTKHRQTRRRKFIKIHTGINVKTREIIFNKSTSSRVSDISVLPDAIKQVGNNFNKLLADGGYDSKSTYRNLPPDVEVLIPPRKNAVKDKSTHQRNKAIDYIDEHSRSRWRREVGFHQRSIVENTFSRWKTIFGENIKSKNEHSQQVEVTLKSEILNKMTGLGMPEWNRIYFLK
jgi:hypothetical protein